MAMIGIDLGTTNSVVTTPQSFEGKFFERIRGITLIKDAYNQRFTPSVVAQTARGELVVGRRAKNRAGLSPPPITSIKRRMGESTRTSLGDRDLLPEEVSAEILRHLKAMAEQQMGEPVEQAVVTVPAHFTQLQKQKTREAAELAGLEVGDIVLEPVAAALAYCHDDQRDPLTIMTYDLGGDTFDVAVLRKEGGELSILALDGDRYLGGCDFDKRLASWILDQLNEGMYELEAPEGSPAWAKLMVYAEWAKIRLSSSEITELMELSTGIVDENGEPVSIELEVPRSVLEEQIEAQIDQSVRLCRRALDKAEPPISPEQVDEIVLVGGSSRIPMVSRKLEQAFDRKPRMENPDLCVALGAAMIARDLGRRMGPVKLGPIPERTSLASIQVTGQVLQTEQITAPSSCTVVLTPADGQVPTRQLVSNHGGFLFAQVPLAPDTANRFVLRLDDSGGQEILSYPLTVVREAVRATARTHPELPPNNVLERPIYIMNGRGLPVVRARTLMPHHCRTSTQTTNQSGMVQIPIFEGRCMIGEFLVRVPADLPEGTLVKIDLTFSADFLVDMVARVDSVDIEERAAITLFPTESIGLAQLRNEYMAVSRIASKAFSRADAGQASAVISRLNSALAACQQELYKRAPNLATGQELLAEVGSLVEQLGVLALDPPPEKLDELLLEIEHQLPALVRNDVGAAMHLWPTLHCLTSLAHEALIARDAAAWKDAYVRSQELRREVDLALAAALPEDPRSIKLKLAMALSRLRQDARNSNKYEDLAPAFSRCSSKLKDIDADRSDAIQRLDRYNKNDYRPLKAQVTGISPANVVPIKKNPIQFPPGIFACMETESRGGKVFFYKCDLERLGNQPPRWIGTHMETHPGSRHRIFLRDENRWIDAEAVPEIKRLLSRERGGGAEMPPGTMDLLQFSVTAPPELLDVSRHGELACHFLRFGDGVQAYRISLCHTNSNSRCCLPDRPARVLPVNRIFPSRSSSPMRRHSPFSTASISSDIHLR